MTRRASLRIAQIDVFQVDLPYSGGVYLLSRGREYRSFDATIIRLTTDDGLEGWGESTPFGATYIAAHALGVRAGIAEIAPAVLGLDPRRVVVAVGARTEQGEGIVTGDVVNTAARIQSVAPVNSVAVSQQTYRATSRVFEYEPLAPVSVKGKVEPIRLWRAKAARSRFGSDVSDRFRTPFVGRELEKPLPIGIFERATQRSVQLVTVVGEPGVGKSRLIAELSSYIDAKPGLFRWRQGRCRPYGEGITLWALGEILKAESGILESDSLRATGNNHWLKCLFAGFARRGWAAIGPRSAQVTSAQTTQPSCLQAF